MPDVEFSKVVPTRAQIQTLYDLLSEREHTISHEGLPAFEDHAKFVETHPYRSWYIVSKDDASLGSFYISKENTIGINLVTEINETLVEEIIRYVQAEYTPLPPIPSVRAGIFAINVPPSNTTLIEVLEGLGSKVLQISYSLNSKT